MKLKIMRRIFTNIIRSYARDAIWNWDPRLFQVEFSSICLHNGRAYMKTWDDMSM
jgi:hypothetical protein